MDRRRAIIGAGRRLPFEYQEVEFLESSGNQYLEIENVQWSDSDKIYCKFEVTGFGSYLSGVYGYTLDRYRQQLYWRDSDHQVAVGFNNVYQYVNYYISVGTVYKTVLEKGKFTINNNEFVIRSNTVADFIQTQYIFATDASRIGKVKIYSYRHYNDNTVKYDLVPCYRKSDHEAGMYDLVNGVFYANAGTGTFSVGADK